MTPTNKLRFVERLLYWDGRTSNAKVEKVLQQWWAPFHRFHDGYEYTSMELKGGEWRDVPVEKEET